MSTINRTNDEEKWWDSDGLSENPFKQFNPKDVSVDIRNYPIGMLLDRIKHNDIDLFPDFQRKYDLWNHRLKSQLIESILLNFPIPPLYFAMSFNDRSLVIDGLQRLWTFKSFILENEFKLEGLTVLSELNGLRFSELEKQHQRKIHEYAVVVYDLRPGVPRFVIYDIFRRLNTSGVSLNGQEVRHAMNHQSSVILREFTSLPLFKNLVRVNRKRMEDDEIALRFIAFYIQGADNYMPPMSLFLDHQMENLKNIGQLYLDSVKSRFQLALDVLVQIFGSDVFSKPSFDYRRAKFNRALFEVLTVSFAQLNQSEHQIILSLRADFIQAFSRLLNEDEFIISISNTTASRYAVMTRFRKIHDIISYFL